MQRPIHVGYRQLLLWSAATCFVAACGDVAIHRAPPQEGDEAGECSDSADNDGDGLFDCEDPDCGGAPECQPELPPSTPEVRIEPEDPGTLDDLSCVLATASVDPEGLPVEYRYQWTVGSFDAEVDTASIPATSTSRDQIWTCTIIATDGILDSAAVSDSVVIGNTAPTRPEVTIVPSFPSSRTDVRCELTVESEDVDGDDLSYSYSWAVQGTTVLAGQLLPWYYTAAFNTLACSARASDGMDEGAAGEDSTEVTMTGLELLTVGRWHSCSTNQDGTYSCWGIDDQSAQDFGQVTANPGGSVAEVSGGERHSCALTYDSGAPVCWGDTSDGQDAPPALASYMQLSSGYDHVCGLSHAGDIGCWGSAYDWFAPPTDKALHISSGDDFSCGIMLEGHIECWNMEFTPPGGSEWVTLDAGGAHACALDSGGLVTCWGDDTSGQLTPEDATVSFSKISAGDAHTCGIESSTQAVQCWGDPDQASGVPAGAFDEIAAGWNHSCARRSNFAVECWGCIDNDKGQCSP